MEKILIDGYNLLYKDGALKNLAERSLEEARQELVAAIASYRSGDTEIVVVFDGRGAESWRLKSSSGVQVRFSRFPQTADEVILEMIEKERRRVSLTVVTSDKKDIGRVARAEGVRWISSEAFIKRLQRVQRSGGTRQEKPVNTPSSEVEYWLERFGPEGRDEKD